MPNWYYEKKELRNTPTILAGIGFETETRYRREGSRFIQELGKALGLRHDTMATGSVYFHRFYMFHSFTEFPRYVTATCALFLAGKAEETPKKCRDIIKTVRSLTNDHQFATFGQDPREEVMTLERVLLQTIKFDLQVDHPYSALIKYAKCLKGDKAKLQKMVQMSWTFVNDSLCTTLCLQCEPEVTAIALMYLAAKLSKFEVKDWKSRTTEHKHWWDQYVQHLETDQLEDICHQVLDLYSQPTIAAKEAPMSPPPGAAPKATVAPPDNPSSKTPLQPTTPRSQQPPPPKNPPHKPVPPSQPTVSASVPPQQPSSTYPAPSFNTPKTSHPVRGPSTPQSASAPYHPAPTQAYPVPQYAQTYPPTIQNGPPHQTTYSTTAFSTYPPPQGHSGPPPQSHQGPPPQTHQAPPLQTHQGPPPQSHQGHPPPSHQGPPPQTHSAPPPGYGYPPRGPPETRGAPYTPEGRGGPPPRDAYNDSRRGGGGPPPHESRDGPPPFRGPRPEFGRGGGGDGYRGAGGHDSYRGSSGPPPRGGSFHRGGPPRRESPYSARPPHRGASRGRY